MNLYELTKQDYATAPPLEEFTKAEETIIDLMRKSKAVYFMLLNNDIRYYTVFNHTYSSLYDECAAEIIDVARSLGTIKDICYNEAGDAIEFWISNQDGEKISVDMFLLFPYDAGVIEI